jgi:hypothetical protein
MVLMYHAHTTESKYRFLDMYIRHDVGTNAAGLTNYYKELVEVPTFPRGARVTQKKFKKILFKLFCFRFEHPY